MAQDFDTWLYSNFNSVYLHGLKELSSNIKLLDVLTMKGRDGVHPVLGRAGSLTDLGTGSSVKIFQEGLADFKSKDPKEIAGEDDLFYWNHGDPNIDQSFESTGSISGSLTAGPVGELNSHFSHSKNLAVKVEGRLSACVSQEKLILLTGKDQWKPNLKDPRLGWNPGYMKRWLKKGPKLWIVQEIQYVSKLEIKSGDSVSVGAKVATMAPGNPGLDMSVSSQGTNVLNITLATNPKIPGKFIFAFRAICLRLNSAGTIQGRDDNAGKVVPHTRMGTPRTPSRQEVEVRYDEAADFRELFLDESSEDEDGEDEDEEDEEEGLVIARPVASEEAPPKDRSKDWHWAYFFVPVISLGFYFLVKGKAF